MRRLNLNASATWAASTTSPRELLPPIRVRLPFLDKVKFFDQNDIEASQGEARVTTTTSTAHFRLPMRIWVSRERQLLRLSPPPSTPHHSLCCSSAGRRHRMLMGAGHLQKPFWSVRWANGNDKGGRGRKRRGVGDVVRAVWHYKNRLLICMTICQVGRTERMPSSSSTGAKLLGSKLPPSLPPLCLLLPCTAANSATDQATVRQYALRHFVSFAAKGRDREGKAARGWMWTWLRASWFVVSFG